MFRKLKKLIFNKSFLIGFFICLSFFSPYIFGPDNLLEELGEWEINRLFGIEIDFSPPDGKSYIKKN